MSIENQPFPVNIQTEDRPQNPRRASSIAQFSLALMGAGSAWAIAAALITWGIVSILVGAPGQADVLQVFMLALAMAMSGLLLLPSAYFAWMRLSGKKPSGHSEFLSPKMFHRLRPDWWIFALPVVIIAGHFIAQNSKLAWFFLPPFHLLAVGIPTAWLLFLAIRNLPAGSPQRFWGLFNSGLGLAPLLIMVFEILAAIGFLVLFGIWLSFQPYIANRLVEIAKQLQEIQSPDAMLEALGPILVNPLVIFSIILFGAVVVPLIEELLKPIGVWLLFGRKMTPAAGFVAGALSGAGYGFLESLALSSNSSGQWSALVLARIGTSAVHILTAAITGWALVQFWQKKRVLRFVLAYLGAVMIHGLWNGLTLLYSFDLVSSMGNLPLEITWIHSLGTITPFALILLAAACFLGLISINRSLSRDPVQAHPPPGGQPGQKDFSESML